MDRSKSARFIIKYSFACRGAHSLFGFVVLPGARAPDDASRRGNSFCRIPIALADNHDESLTTLQLA